MLTRALREEDAHASVALLSAATMLGMKLLAAGRVQRSSTDHAWQIGPLDAEDLDRVRELARARAYADLDAEAAEQVVRRVLDAVADTMTRQPGRPAAPPAEPRRESAALDLEQDDLPGEVALSLRVEAPEELLVGGHVLVVPQVRAVEQDAGAPVSPVDAEVLWGDRRPRVRSPGPAQHRRRAAGGRPGLAGAGRAAAPSGAGPAGARRRRARRPAGERPGRAR